MNRLILILSFYLTGSYFHSIFGQMNKFEIELEGGPGISFFYGNKVPEGSFKPIVAGYVGVLFQYHFSPHFSLKSGLSYERKGTNFVLESWNFRTDYMYKLDYLTIPLLIQAEYGKKVCFYANTGLYFSYLLNQNYTGENERSGAGYWLHISPNSTHNKNNFDFGICAETGMKVKVSNELAIYFGLCDRLGLFNTEKQPLFVDEIGNQVNSETTSFNNVTLLILGCSYRFGSIKK